MDTRSVDGWRERAEKAEEQVATLTARCSEKEAERQLLDADLQNLHERYQHTKDSLIAQLQGAERRAIRAEEQVATLTARLKERQKDLDYHADCRPNRREAEAAMADAKAMNDNLAKQLGQGGGVSPHLKAVGDYIDAMLLTFRGQQRHEELQTPAEKTAWLQMQDYATTAHEKLRAGGLSPTTKEPK